MSFLMVLPEAASSGVDHSSWRSDPLLKLDQRSSDSPRKVWWPTVAQPKASDQSLTRGGEAIEHRTPVVTNSPNF